MVYFKLLERIIPKAPVDLHKSTGAFRESRLAFLKCTPAF